MMGKEERRPVEMTKQRRGWSERAALQFAEGEGDQRGRARLWLAATRRCGGDWAGNGAARACRFVVQPVLVQPVLVQAYTGSDYENCLMLRIVSLRPAAHAGPPALVLGAETQQPALILCPARDADSLASSGKSVLFSSRRQCIGS